MGSPALLNAFFLALDDPLTIFGQALLGFEIGQCCGMFAKPVEFQGRLLYLSALNTHEEHLQKMAHIHYGIALHAVYLARLSGLRRKRGSILLGCRQ